MRKPEEIATAFSPTDTLNGRSTFFLVGIGGAGMSAIARMLKHRGYEVSGTDSTESAETDRLTAEGIGVTIGHTGEPLKNLAAKTSAVILTDAIDLNNSPEVDSAKDLGLPMLRRSQALGWLLKDKKVIAVTGTHGKSTTTGLLGNALIAAGLQPLVVGGAKVLDFNGPVYEGEGEWAVVEACEAYDSFHDLKPYHVVLTNLELDHVDFHGSLENLRSSVLRFVSSMADTGTLIYCADDLGASELAGSFGGSKIGYSETSDRSDAYLSGDHNRLNMAGAAAAASLTGADSEKVDEGLKNFHGVERRLQVLLEGPITVIDDYAHHPTEITASLQAVRERGIDGRLIVVFQPHLYSRTGPLISEFAAALNNADMVILTDIYPAREEPIPGVSSSRIAEKISKPLRYVPSRHLLPMAVAQIAKTGDVVVAMGAGNIDQFPRRFIAELERRNRKNRKVAVVYGGDSPEREVGLRSGREIYRALREKGHEPTLIDVTDLLLRDGNIRQLTGPDRPDVAFLAVHGTHAEDGAIQGFFELLHIPYTGSNIRSSANAMDKAAAKQILEQNGIRTPKGTHLKSRRDPLEVRPPLIVKPNSQGSTVGLSFVTDSGELEKALDAAFSYDTDVLVEEWITGMEISVPVLAGKALLPVEIAPASGFYDFESKYTTGATEEIIPARLSQELLEESGRIALQAHRALDCQGATRTDMIVRGEEIFVLEVNTLPGMTKTSLLPNSARVAGIKFEDLCEIVMEDAITRHAEKA